MAGSTTDVCNYYVFDPEREVEKISPRNMNNYFEPPRDVNTVKTYSRITPTMEHIMMLLKPDRDDNIYKLPEDGYKNETGRIDITYALWDVIDSLNLVYENMPDFRFNRKNWYGDVEYLENSNSEPMYLIFKNLGGYHRFNSPDFNKRQYRFFSTNKI